MADEQRVCANCRVLVQPVGARPVTSPLVVWEHVPEFAAKFSRSACDRPAPGRSPSGSEARFGMGRVKSRAGADKWALTGAIDGLAQPAGTPITVAVDGSYKLTVGDRVVKPMSWAYLATNGLYGLGTSLVPGSVVGGHEERKLQAELRAIAHALAAVAGAHPVTVLCDSRDAINFMLLWRDGYDVMPGGYDTERAGGRESTIGRLARRAREGGDRITMQWVRGHSGHPLNEAADTLAKMARAWATGRLDKTTAAAAAPPVVLAALAGHANGAAA